MRGKKSAGELRAQFNEDVDRFSDLRTAQRSVIDAPLMLRLLAEGAVRLSGRIGRVLDVGCGAGNNALMLLQTAGRRDIEVDLLDLAPRMLERARERVSAATAGAIRTLEEDVREVELEAGRYDVVTAAAVLHHLREEAEWRSVFAKLFRSLRPGGTLWISDLVLDTTPEISSESRAAYGAFLDRTGGEAYRREILEAIDACDTPRPLLWQLRLLEASGFVDIELLHKHACFAAFGARKPL